MKKLSAFGSIAGIALITITATFAACVGSDPEVGPGGGGDGGADAGDGGSSDGNTSDVVITCTGSKTACGDSCVDLTSDNANCGKCGNACGGCYLGTCEGKKVTDVSAGQSFSCVVLAAGSVWCWGANEEGELGSAPGAQTCSTQSSTWPCNPTPAAVVGVTDATHVATGQGFACALKSDGSVWCWGDNSVGELGHDPATDSADGGPSACPLGECDPTPRPVLLADGGALGGMSSIAAGAHTACAEGASAGYCWGADVDDQRGDGVEDDGGTAYRPPAALVGGGGEGPISVSTHFVHACAIQGGTLSCWGDNFQDALGHAASTYGDTITPTANYRYRNNSPVVVHDTADAGVSNVISVAAIDGPTCAVRSDNSLSCWGFNCAGTAGTPLGANCNNFQSAFTATSMVGGITTGVASVSGIEEHACAVAVNHQVWCWGANWSGQIGNGSYVGNPGSSVFCPSSDHTMCFPSPQQTPGVLATKVSAGFDFTLALGTDGVTYGWGTNGAGQTGHSPSTQGDANCTEELCNPSPVAVIGLP